MKKTHQKFLNVFKYWENELNHYSEKDLEKRENAGTWTLGQVYQHLISSTLNFHLSQVKTCLNNAENKSAKKNFKGFMAYHLLNAFPPIRIKVPPSAFYTPAQPGSKAEILENFALIKKEMAAVLPLFNQNLQGKTAHPGFSFLNAQEWYRLIEMHWRHHKRQKARLDQL
ncbi:MAG TPA: DinB family protein [Bacteroidetes bacterium]|nr:DinB family protein [Bacteroidota bacterium]